MSVCMHPTAHNSSARTSFGSSAPTASIPDATRFLSPLAVPDSQPPAATAADCPSPVRISRGFKGMSVVTWPRQWRARGEVPLTVKLAEDTEHQS